MNASSIQQRAIEKAALIRGAAYWRLSPAGRLLLAPADLDLSGHIQRGAAEVVKHGPHRTVYKICLRDSTIFWKHCRISDLGSYLRQCIRPPKARLEFDRAIALADRGIDAIEPLAWGKAWWRLFGPSHLITRELTGAIPLHAFMLERRTGRPRREAALLLGEYLARLHEAGVAHPDMHPGNVLVTEGPAGKPRFHLLDIHNVRLGPRLSARQSLANLAVFNRWFAMRSERTDRLRFWKHYADLRGFGVDERRTLSRRIEERTLRSNQAFWKRRADRCVTSNRYFRKVRGKGVFGRAVREIDQPFLDDLLRDPDAPFRELGQGFLKDSPSSTVVEIVVPTPTGPRAMIFKRFKLKKRLAALANRFRCSAALRSWRLGHALLDRGLPTPRPWLVLHRRGLTGPREGYLLCEKVENATDIRSFLARQTSLAARRNVIASLGRLLFHMHRSGVRHRDLKAANLLASIDHNGVRIDFIDLVGVYPRRHLSETTRGRDLSRLNASFIHDAIASHTDRLRFLRAYMCWGLYGRVNWKKWWSCIDRATRVKAERNQRLGRPLA